jgi:DNA-binding LacI/PurR family transcriptional regulator
VFRSHGSANGAARSSGSELVDVARLAGVSTGTASAALNCSTSVGDATADRVLSAARWLR